MLVALFDELIMYDIFSIEDFACEASRYGAIYFFKGINRCATVLL